MTTTQEALRKALDAMQNIGVSLNDYDSYALELICNFADGHLAALSQQEPQPVLYQSRMRPDWYEPGLGWTKWEDCSAESYEEYERLSKLPHYNDWQYEVRKLYAAATNTEQKGPK